MDQVENQSLHQDCPFSTVPQEGEAWESQDESEEDDDDEDVEYMSYDD